MKPYFSISDSSHENNSNLYTQLTRQCFCFKKMYLKCFLHKKNDVFILILLFYVNVCFPECIICMPCVCLVPEAKRGCWEPKPGPIQEQQVLNY